MMAPSSETDAALVAAVRDTRDVVAFAELVRRYQNAAFAVALSVAGDRQLAEDAAQETFLCAWANLDRLRDPTRVAPWLCGIARNVARRLIRDRAREVIDDDPDIEPASDATPLHQLMEREADEALSRLLGRVPGRYRAPMVLHYAAEQSVSQIARCLDLSEPNVKKLLSRGRELLRDRAERFTELASACRAPATLAVAVIATLGARTAAAQATATAGMSNLVASGVAVKKSVIILGAVVACVVSLLGIRLLNNDDDDAVASTPSVAPLSTTPVGAQTPSDPARSRRLAGVVVDDHTSTPLAGATVLVSRAVGGTLATTIDEQQHPPAIVVTDRAGRFVFDVAAGHYYVDANLAGYVAVKPAQVEIRTADDGVVEVRLARGGHRVHGTITDIKGGPIAAAIVTAQAAPGGVPTGRSKAAITKHDGSYELWLAIGDYALRAEHDAYAPASADLTVSREIERDLRLVPASYIEGVVLDRKDARPIAGAIVFVDNQAELAARTDGDGRFRLAQLTAGTFALRARAEHQVTLAPSMIELDIGQTRSGVELLLDRGANVSGRVVDEAGRPVAGAGAGLVHFTEGVAYEARAPTDDEGRFVIDGVAPGSYGAAVHAANRPLLLRRKGVDVAEQDVGDVELVVSSARTITGRVVPARAATIRLARPAGPELATLALSGDLSDFLNLETATTRTRPDGSFEIAAAPAGAYTVVAVADDGMRGEAPVTIERDETVTITLAETPTLRGTIVDPRGKPIAGIGLHVTSDRYYPEQSANTFTDAAGGFVLRGLAPGGYRASIVDERCSREIDGKSSSTITIAPKPADLRIVATGCERTVRGIVVDKQGARVADAWVHVESEDFHVPALLTDGDGRFAATGLHDSAFTVTAYHPTRGRARLESAGTDTNHTIKLSGETSLRIVVKRNGQPAAGYELRVRGAVERSVRSRDPDGSVTVGNLTAGRYTIEAIADIGSATADVVVEAGAPRTIELALRDWSVVRGRLVGADGRPLAGHVVVPFAGRDDKPFAAEEFLTIATATTDRDGRFELRRVQPNSKALVVSSPSGEFSALPLRVEPGENRDLGTVTVSFTK